MAPGSNPTHTLVHLICSFHSLIDSIIACSWIVNYRKLNTKERVRSKFKTEKKTIFYFITIFLRSFFIFVRWGKFWNWRSSIFCWLWWCIRVRHVVKAILKSASSELTKLWKPKAIPPPSFSLVHFFLKLQTLLINLNNVSTNTRNENFWSGTNSLI